MQLKTSLKRVVFVLILLALPACGVRFSETFDGTELFRSLSLEGERVTNAELTVHVEISQGYPAPVTVICAYENGDELSDDQKKLSFPERATSVGMTVVPPAPESEPGDEDLPETELSYSFSIGSEGSYFIACFTPAAPDNGIGLSFKIVEAGQR